MTMLRAAVAALVLFSAQAVIVNTCPTNNACMGCSSDPEFCQSDGSCGESCDEGFFFMWTAAVGWNCQGYGLCISIDALEDTKMHAPTNNTEGSRQLSGMDFERYFSLQYRDCAAVDVSGNCIFRAFEPNFAAAMTIDPEVDATTAVSHRFMRSSVGCTLNPNRFPNAVDTAGSLIATAVLVPGDDSQCCKIFKPTSLAILVKPAPGDTRTDLNDMAIQLYMDVGAPGPVQVEDRLAQIFNIKNSYGNFTQGAFNWVTIDLTGNTWGDQLWLDRSYWIALYPRYATIPTSGDFSNGVQWGGEERIDPDVVDRRGLRNESRKLDGPRRTQYVARELGSEKSANDVQNSCASPLSSPRLLRVKNWFNRESYTGPSFGDDSFGLYEDFQGGGRHKKIKHGAIIFGYNANKAGRANYPCDCSGDQVSFPGP